MAVRTIASADRGARFDGSYSRNVCDLNCGIGTFEWTGYCLVPGGTSMASSLDVIVPFRDGKGGKDVIGMTMEPTSFITKIGLQLLGEVTMGSATGRLKLAATINEASQPMYVESGAAVAGKLSPAGFMRKQFNNLATAPNTGANPITFKLFATDGGAGAAAAPSTVTAATETKVLITICGYLYLIDPTEQDIGFSSPR